MLIQTAANGLWSSLLLLVKLIGVIVTGLLLWFEVDKSNPVLKHICSAGKNISCMAVLGSKQAKLFGWVSWSEIGFFYFTGGFLSLLLTANPIDIGWQLQTFSLLSWFNISALPYIIFSIYYQWYIAKQWCPLCLAIQALLVFEFIVSYFGYWSSASNELVNLSTNHLLPLLTSFLLPLFFWLATKKKFLQAQHAERHQKEAGRLKYNKEIFTSLLHQQKQITTSTEGLGIIIGDPAAENTIVKVCSPYCGPCAKAHGVIDEILENNENVKVQIIFTAPNDEEDYRAKPVRYLMALYEKKDNALMQNALDDWYGSEKKDYRVFSAKYSLGGELQNQGQKLEAMDKWCRETGISFTPTFFVNGYQMPDIYNIDDLKHFI